MTKRLVLLSLCLLISGVSSVIDLNPQKTAADPLQNEYWISVGPINGSTSATYTYASLFNPSNSGKTIVAKRVRFNSDAVAGATYQDLNIRRITGATGGTLIQQGNVPKKNTDSVNTIAEVRHTGVTSTLIGTNDARMFAAVAAGAVGNSTGGRDYTFVDEDVVLQPGEGIALYQNAAGDADQRIRMAVEWEELAVAPSAQNSYMLALPRVEVAATANYKYQTLANPTGSGKSISISRLNLDMDCDAAAVFTNNVYIQRATTISGGTAVGNSDIVKKHTNSAAPVMEARHTNVTATPTGTADSTILEVAPCGAASQPHSHREIVFDNEGLVLTPGQGIALISSGVGDVDQLVRMSAVWSEAASYTSQNEYALSIGPVNGNATANTNFIQFFNPTTSGKTAVVKKLNIRIDTGAAATANNFTLQRVSGTTPTGTQITAANIPKKHTSSVNSVIDVRHTTPAGLTKVGGTNARLLTVTAPSAAAQLMGHKVKDFSGDEKLILKPGEGILLFQETAGNVAHRVKMFVEWSEVTTAPTAAGEYMVSMGHILGGTNTNYGSIFNPSGSGKSIVFKRIAIRVESLGAANYVPFTLQRTSAASGGTQIVAADIPRKHTSTGTPIADVRHTNVTATRTGTAAARIVSVTSPGAVQSAIAPNVSGYTELDFVDNESLILSPGQGIVLYQEAASNSNHRIHFFAEWSEVVSAPTAQNEYIYSSGPHTGTITSGQSYATMMNPSGTGKYYSIKRVEIRADRVGTGTSYVAASVRRLSVVSGGTTTAATDISKKHPSTADSSAEIRAIPTSATYSSDVASRYSSVTTPGAVGQDIGLNESNIISGDELILAPGEGIGLYQEAAADTGLRFRLRIVWAEVTIPVPTINQSAYRWYNNADSLTPGTSLANENTAATLNDTGDAVRLRMGLSISDNPLNAASQQFKLQHSTSTAGPWADVNANTTYPNSKLPNPASLPPGVGNEVAWSPDGTYMSVAHNFTPFVTIYKRSGDTFTKLADPAALPASAGNDTSWSPDGTYMTVTHNTTPFITIYKQSGDTFTKLADPAALPTDGVYAVSWSPDGTYMSVGHFSAPYITIYKRSGDTFTKLANPAALPAGSGFTIAWSPDGTYMSVGYNVSPFITVYKRSGDMFTKLADPAAPAGTARDVAWSPDGTFMAVGHQVSPFITVYKQSGDTFTKLADPAALPAEAGFAVAWSPDGTFMAVGHQVSPFITIYRRNGDTFIKQTQPPTLPGSTSNGIVWSPDGTYMSVAHTSSPFITIYKTSPPSSWTYADNATPADGAVVPSPLLSGSPVVQSYTESNPTATNPNIIDVGERGEWDFALDSTNVAANTTYYFRMVESDGTALDTYSQYPQLTVPAARVMDQSAYRWYDNADSVQPGAAKAAENTPATLASAGDIVRLRKAITVTGNSLPANNKNFKLQHSTSTTGPWTDVSRSLSTPPEKLADPAALPAGAGNGVAWSPDGTYMSVAHSTSPFITIYKRSGDTFTKLADPAALPASTGNSVDWSPDGTYMSVAHNTSPFVTIYKRSGDTFTKLANPATLPTGIGRGTSWSADGTYMSVAHATSPYITIYKRSGDTFTKLANPAALPVTTSTGVEWSPDDMYMSVTQNFSPYIVIYKRSGDTFTKLADPTDLPTSSSTGVDWSPDGTYMSVADISSPYITIYRRSGDTFIKLADPATLPVGAAGAVDWSADGAYMSVAHSTTPFVTTYKWDTSAVSAWSFADNITPTDKTTITSAVLSGSPSLQSYSESNPTATNPNAINVGNRGEWDFALDSTNAAPGSTYYFRMTDSEGAALNSYSQLPEIYMSPGNTAPDVPTLLAQKKGITTLDTGDWSNSNSITFSALATDPDAADMLELCVEIDLLGTSFSGTPDECGTAQAYTGLAVPIEVNVAAPTDPGEYHWQARIRDSGGLTSATWTSYGSNLESVRDFGVDTTAPSGGTVNDGSGADIAFNNGSLSELSANWSGFNNNLSGLQKYEYSIGTVAGGTTIRGWTDVGTATSVNAINLTLQTSSKYFFNVRATDNAGNSSIVSSNGQLVAPTVSFSVSPSIINMSNLNASNSFTDTKTTTLTTSTNAYGGYVVRSFVSDLFRTASNQTIPTFNGGNYAAPDAWRSGDVGFGYTSNDTTIQGVSNKFGTGGCTVTGLPSTCLFAPFSQTAPGDIVADHTANVSGTPIANQSFTVTYRASTTNTQAASKYNTRVVYTITPIY